jgi:tetratricopeptide (TPR) repeat protein
VNERRNDRSKLVPFAAALRRPDPARVAQFADTARRLKQERAASEDIVTSALRDTPREAWPRLRNMRELHSSGALDRLGQEIDKRLDTDPREALAIAELAAFVADALAPDTYPAIMLAQLRAHAWRDRGQALSYLGRYDEALRALDHAEEQFREFGNLGHDIATVRFCRATVLQHLRRFDEARAVLDECRQVFREYGDVKSYVKCTLATGNLLVRMNDHRAARETLRSIILADHPEYEPIVRVTLGWCAIHLSEVHEALQHFVEAERLFAVSGRELHSLRAACGVGSALLRLGHINLAIERLRTVREGFLAHKLPEEAGISGLELVEAHLLDSDTDAAKALSAAIVREFSNAGLNRRAIAALAYLRDAVSASTATVQVVRSVHDYLVALRADPDCDFAAIN